MFIDLTEECRPLSAYPPVCLEQPGRQAVAEDLSGISRRRSAVMGGCNRPFRQLMAGEFIDGSQLPRRLRTDEITGLAELYVQELDDQLVALGGGRSRVRAKLDGGYNAVAIFSPGSTRADVAALRSALRRANKLLYQVLADIDHFASVAG